MPTMSALQFELSIPRYLLNKGLSAVCSHRFFPGASCVHHRDAVEIPALPGPDWVLVKVEACGICGSDLNTVRGHESFSLEPYGSFPAVMGHETIGRVAHVGAEVRGVAEGTRVAVEPVLACAARGVTPPCAQCAVGDYALCDNFTGGCLAPGVVLGFTKGLGGGFGEYVAAHVSQIFPIADALPREHAVLIDSIASALQPVAQHLPRNDATVLVYGAGVIGLHAVQCLRAAGFTGRLFVVARHPVQVAWAKKLGATECLSGDLYRVVADVTHARLHKPTIGPPVLDGGVDCVFDCVGSSATIDASLRLTRRRGKVVLVGTAGVMKVDAVPLWFKEVTLIGSSMYAHSAINGRRARTYQHVIDWLAAGKLQLDGFVTHTFPISDYAQAFNVALDKKRHNSVKVVLVPERA